MNKKLQTSIFDVLYERLHLLQQTKPDEYSTDENVFTTFDAIAKESGLSRFEVLKVLQAKHTISIKLAVNDLLQGEHVNHDYLLEKVGDFINYQMIFFSMLIDRDDDNHPRRRVFDENEVLQLFSDSRNADIEPNVEFDFKTSELNETREGKTTSLQPKEPINVNIPDGLQMYDDDYTLEEIKEIKSREDLGISESEFSTDEHSIRNGTYTPRRNLKSPDKYFNDF